MRSIVSALILTLISTFSISAWADNSPTKVDAPLGSVYTPDGFDDNDNVQIVGEGIFRDSCYRPADANARVDVDRKEIILDPKAYKYDGMCLQVLVPFEMTFNLGPLKAGTYSIKRASDGSVLGNLTINRSRTADADDYIYAPISQAFFSMQSSSASVFLTGEFSLSCMKIRDVQFLVQKDVLVIQPIAEIDSQSECTNGKFNFSKSVDLGSLKSGKYLLHVRSMNGKSINNLVAVP